MKKSMNEELSMKKSPRNTPIKTDGEAHLVLNLKKVK